MNELRNDAKENNHKNKSLKECGKLLPREVVAFESTEIVKYKDAVNGDK